MTRFYDGTKAVSISIQKWDEERNSLSPAWERDFFDVSQLTYDEENDWFLVDDVDYLIDYAQEEFAEDESMMVFTNGINISGENEEE